jgi:hypothetical protein
LFGSLGFFLGSVFGEGKLFVGDSGDPLGVLAVFVIYLGIEFD